MERFTYRGLSHELPQVRLIYLLPGIHSEAIRCEIVHYRLRSHCAFGLYEALSYVWGRLLEVVSLINISKNSWDDKLYNLVDPLKDSFKALLVRPWLERIWVITARSYHSMSVY